jgi:hypothetical protein
MWNTTVPPLFSLPSITYVHALFLKLALVFFVGSEFSDYLLWKQGRDTELYYMNKIYLKIDEAVKKLEKKEPTNVVYDNILGMQYDSQILQRWGNDNLTHYHHTENAV